MEDGRKKISFEQFEDVINILSPSIDSYLYIFDMKRDLYCLSENATDRFPVPAEQFTGVMEKLGQLVHPNDFILLQEDFMKIMNREKDYHNLQYRWLDKKGKDVWINCRGQVLYDEDGAPEFLVGCINEIGRRQKADNVSGLLGESSLYEEIKRCTEDRTCGFMLRVGIDNFKEINENKGMKYGDMILRKVAECIGAVVSEEQKVYRIVADEFAVLDFSDGVAEALRLFDRIRWKISLFIEENEYEVFFTISAGIVDFASVHNQNYFNVMKWTEFSLSQAKLGGKNRAYAYDEKDYKEFLGQRKLIHYFRKCVNDDFRGFEAYFQPVVDIKENRLSGAETLLRFTMEDGRMISPSEFIPLLEESGLIIPVGRWVLQQAMDACRKIRRVIPDFKVSVNVSYIQVLKSDVLGEILGNEKKYGLEAGSLIVELTESGFFESDDNFIRFCDGLKEHQIPLALDDFGTGYSNFHYLYDISPNTIKIDRSFTLKALNSEYDYNLLQLMVQMTHSIQLKLCIEGIETEQELNKISQMGPDYIQGYYFGRPCPLEQFIKEFVEN